MAFSKARSGRVALVALAATTALALSGCSIVSSFAAVTTVPKQGDYPSWADTQAPHDESTPAPPRFVPHDATNMYVRTLPSGDAILTYRSPTPPSPELCDPGQLTGKPPLDSTWWPITKPPAAGERCSPGWRVFQLDGVTYGWKDVPE
jgi:hypothetical protein